MLLMVNSTDLISQCNNLDLLLVLFYLELRYLFVDSLLIVTDDHPVQYSKVCIVSYMLAWYNFVLL